MHSNLPLPISAQVLSLFIHMYSGIRSTHFCIFDEDSVLNTLSQIELTIICNSFQIKTALEFQNYNVTAFKWPLVQVSFLTNFVPICGLALLNYKAN